MMRVRGREGGCEVRSKKGYIVEVSPLRVTPFGIAKSVTKSGVSLYAVIFIMR